VVKRSPILGYNHNVRYRGLVFHVQTEDSGVLSPHLFTHLFHHGVIVSTRKLVYDSGAAEEAIKALMQAQHKAVLKDLKRGAFDDKIDQYLAGTPGLLPRGLGEDGAGLGASADPQLPIDGGPITVPEVRTEAELALSREPTIQQSASSFDPAMSLRPTEPNVGSGPLVPARTKTAERMSAPSRVGAARSAPPADAPSELAALGTMATVRTARLDDQFDHSGVELGALAETARVPSSPDSQPEIYIFPPEEDAGAGDAAASRSHDAAPRARDAHPISDGVPGAVMGPPTLRTEPPGAAPERRSSKAVGAAALPPARPISRPASRPAMAAPQVVSRPVAPEDRRTQYTDAIEVYAPAPPSAELPPAAASAGILANLGEVGPGPGDAAPERPGQYSQHKKLSTRIPVDPPPPPPPAEGRRLLHPQQGTVPTAGMAPRTTPPSAPPASRTPPPTPPAVAAAASGPSAAPRVPAPAARPGPTAPITARAPHGPAGPPARPTPVPRPSTVPAAIPPVRDVGRPPARPAAASPASRAAPVAAPRPRTPTPARTPNASPPPRPSSPIPVIAAASGLASAPASTAVSSRTGSGGAASGVVVTRPAVIVGAPAKPAPGTQRVRKAREDEGRGFGQGLISEKSLDEVILAYLSEDAEEK
jgi:hypothetical protein